MSKLNGLWKLLELFQSYIWLHLFSRLMITLLGSDRAQWPRIMVLLNWPYFKQDCITTVQIPHDNWYKRKASLHCFLSQSFLQNHHLDSQASIFNYQIFQLCIYCDICNQILLLLPGNLMYIVFVKYFTTLMKYLFSAKMTRQQKVWVGGLVGNMIFYDICQVSYCFTDMILQFLSQ